MGQGAGSRVGTGRFQALGQTAHSTCTQPPHRGVRLAQVVGVDVQHLLHRAVVLQVAFERRTLKPAFSRDRL
jgi:hypothetical protein